MWIQVFGTDARALSDPMGPEAILRCGLLVATLAVAGWPFAAHVSPTRPERVANALALGLILVALGSFGVGLATGLRLGPVVFGGTALAIGGLGEVWRRWRRLGAPAWPGPDPLAGTAPLAFAIALAVAAGLVVLFQYDEYLSLRGSCLMEGVVQVVSPEWGLVSGPVSVPEHQMLMNPLAVAPFYGWLGMDGFRTMAAITAILTTFHLVALGTRRLGHVGWGLAIAVLGVLAPYVVQIPTADENLIAAQAATFFLYTLLGLPRSEREGGDDRRVANGTLLVSGLAYGAYLASRYTQVLTLPGVALLLTQTSGWRPRRLLAFALPAAVIGGFVLMQVAFSGVPFETYDIRVPGFVEEWSRRPYKAFPSAILMPVYWLRHLGVLTVAITALGAVAWSVRRGWGRGLLLFALPPLALLASMEIFIKPNTHGIPLMLLPVAALAFGEGLKSLASSPLRSAGIVALFAAGLGAGVWALRTVDWPVLTLHDDDRLMATVERPFAARERDDLLELHVLPDPSTYARYSTPLVGWKLAGARPWLDGDWCHLRPDSPAVTGPRDSAVLVVDLDEPFEAYAAWTDGPIEGASSAPLVPIGPADHASVVTLFAFHPAWTPDVVRVAILPCGSTIYVVRVYDNRHPEVDPGDAASLHDTVVDEGLEFLMPFHLPRGDLRFVDLPAPTQGRAALPIAGATEVVFLEVVTDKNELAYRWRVTWAEGPARTDEPRLFWSP